MSQDLSTDSSSLGSGDAVIEPAFAALAIVGLNLLVFALGMLSPQAIGGNALTNGWGVVPKEITTGQDLLLVVDVPGFVQHLQLTAAPFGVVWLTLLTSIFMYGGWLQLLSNTLFLLVFGASVEPKLDSLKFVLLYLLSGLGANLAHIFLDGMDSYIPSLSASGAVAGILAAYLVFRPPVRLLGVGPVMERVPALIVLGVCLLTQFAAVALQEPAAGAGLVYWPIIGGFVTGFVASKLLSLFSTRSRV